MKKWDLNRSTGLLFESAWAPDSSHKSWWYVGNVWSNAGMGLICATVCAYAPILALTIFLIGPLQSFSGLRELVIVKGEVDDVYITVLYVDEAAWRS